MAGIKYANRSNMTASTQMRSQSTKQMTATKSMPAKKSKKTPTAVLGHPLRKKLTENYPQK